MGGKTTKDIGSLIFNETDVKVLAVPSLIVPQEYNYLLNPARLLPGDAIIRQITPIAFDGRIKQ